MGVGPENRKRTAFFRFCRCSSQASPSAFRLKAQRISPDPANLVGVVPRLLLLAQTIWGLDRFSVKYNKINYFIWRPGRDPNSCPPDSKSGVPGIRRPATVMLRLGSSATAILDPRSRQPLWCEFRSSRAASRNTGEICAIGMFGPSHCFQRS